jgi:hypothetical protein
MKIILKTYMHKKYFGKEEAKMHCVGHFIVLMITKKLMYQLLKLCIVLFVTII